MEQEKKWLNFLVGTFLFFSLIAMNLFLVVYLSLGYENVQSKILSITNSSDSSQIDFIYYAEYDCGFFDCLKKGYDVTFVLSKHSQKYWSLWLYASILAVILLTVALFFLMDNTSHFFIGLGSAFVAASLSFSTVNVFVLLSKIFNSGILTELVLAMFSEVTKVFLLLLVVGIILIVFGFLMKFFYFGEHIFERIKGK